jgi:hypothetical protein
MSEAYRLKLAEQLAAPPLNDLPARLRELADRIERGIVQTDGILLVFDDACQEDLVVIGLGDYDPYKAHYSLHQALLTMAGR